MTSRQDAFDEAEERIRLANAQLRADLLELRDSSGSDASHVLLFSTRNAGFGTISEVIETLMACVDALSARVAILELNAE